MIGLGSNRLTVCRRGGMSVTQAGRGGMEWLAGGRRPRWSSPYSAQATAALQAQFPTQWPTIRDYGFAHPEIVGYMNAYAPEDAKIAYSLVEGIGTRWLKGDGVAWVLTDYLPTSDSHIIVDYALQPNRSLYGRVFDSDGTTGAFNNPRTLVVNYESGTLHVSLFGDTSWYSYSQYKTTDYTMHRYEVDKNKFYVDGNLLRTGSSSEYTANGNMSFFRGQTEYSSNVGTNKETDNGMFYRCICDGELRFIPFKRTGGECGVMDLITGVFCGNANSSGSFTISESSPS